MQTRKSIVSGQFYPAKRNDCIDEINDCLNKRMLSVPLPETIAGGIVPHSGWKFSGSLVAVVFSAIKQKHEKVDTFIILGTGHAHPGNLPVIDDKDIWATPLGEVTIDNRLAEAVLNSGTATTDPKAHAFEHSVEVVVPFVQYLFSGARILPIIVPPGMQAMALGESIGDIINSGKKKIICIASTCLTHYGPRYGFTPMGVGREGLTWARKVNDKEFIDLALNFKAEELLTYAAKNASACGPGAVAAAVAAAKKQGKTEGLVLAHTDSNEVMSLEMGTSGADTVGYVAIVF